MNRERDAPYLMGKKKGLTNTDLPAMIDGVRGFRCSSGKDSHRGL